jgi:cystathionine beta-synthase
MKDRVARNIVEDAERRGLLGPGGTIVEATSGNTGMGLALVAALRGYACVFVMPDKMSQEKVAGLRAFGARCRHLPHRRRARGPAQLLPDRQADRAGDAGRVLREPVPQPRQPGCALPLDRRPRSGRRPPARSTCSWPGWGPGGTISGCGRFFKEKKPGFRLVGVDPIGSL